jgi:hypothetical protein
VEPSLAGFHHIALLSDMQNAPAARKERIVRAFLGHKKHHAVNYMKRVKADSNAAKVDHSSLSLV